jgi:hypothetical protein
MLKLVLDQIEIAYNLHSDKFVLPKLESFAAAWKDILPWKIKIDQKDILTLTRSSLSLIPKDLCNWFDDPWSLVSILFGCPRKK